MHLMYKLLNKIYAPCCVEANLNVWLIRSVFGGMAGGYIGSLLLGDLSPPRTTH